MTHLSLPFESSTRLPSSTDRHEPIRAFYLSPKSVHRVASHRIDSEANLLRSSRSLQSLIVFRLHHSVLILSSYQTLSEVIDSAIQKESHTYACRSLRRFHFSPKASIAVILRQSNFLLLLLLSRQIFVRSAYRKTKTTKHLPSMLSLPIRFSTRLLLLRQKKYRAACLSLRLLRLTLIQFSEMAY